MKHLLVYTVDKREDDVSHTTLFFFSLKRGVAILAMSKTYP